MTSRYLQSKVYKLVDDSGYYYFGSTCIKFLHKRLFQHKQKAKIEPNRKIYTIFNYERFVNNEIKIVLVEEFNLQNKEQLLKEENKYIEKCIDDPKCLNSFHAILNFKKRKDHQKEQSKKYYSENKNIILEKVKLHSLKNKEHIQEYAKEYRKNNSEKIKEYINNNKEKIAKYHKEYQKNNQEKIKGINNRYESKVVKCSCGCTLGAHSYNKHLNSKKHLNYINNLGTPFVETNQPTH